MPAKTGKYACGDCKKKCGSSSISCSLCELWYHSSCQDINADELKVWGKILSYGCASCRTVDGTDFDYLMGLHRLQEVRKPVPVIIPPGCIQVMAYLSNTEVRRNAGIMSSNKYVFASSGAGVIRGYDALSSVYRKAGLKKPECLTSTNLRRYMATMTQSFDISSQEMQWVCDHLGHTLDVHKTHYRSVSDVFERVEIAKLLLIQDMNLVGKFHGQKLKDTR